MGDMFVSIIDRHVSMNELFDLSSNQRQQTTIGKLFSDRNASRGMRSLLKSFKYMYMENFLATQAFANPENISEPQTGIEPATFLSPVRRSNHWATKTQMAERRLRYVLVRKWHTYS